MIEISCETCTAVCCKGPLTMSLTLVERDQMAEAGTEFITVLYPVDYDRPDAPYPRPGTGFHPDDPEELLQKMREDGEVEPLPAGYGRYVMMGKCGNLTTFLGREICVIYPERPKVCRDFQVGARTCRLMRIHAGLDQKQS